MFKNNILINIHHGNEIYICDDLCELLDANVPATLANSKYVLFELPLNNKLFNVMEIVVKLKEKDIYQFWHIQKDIHMFKRIQIK